MRFLKSAPARKRKHYQNPVTDHPAFVQMLKALRADTGGGAISFEADEPKQLGVKFPWRVATDTLRRIIREEGLPYEVRKYRTDSGGWAVQSRRKEQSPGRTSSRETDRRSRRIA